MGKLKLGLCAAFVMAALCGTAMLTDTSSSPVAAQEKGPGDHWRWHDGRWSYWYPADNRWYYTDGSHWYYNDNSRWNVYRFDREFGRKNFERGTYKNPADGDAVTLPRHGVYVPR